MKQNYATPEVQIIRISEDNIIATSGGGLANGGVNQPGISESFDDFVGSLQ